MTQTEELKKTWASSLLMFKQGDATLEVTLEMLTLACKRAELVFKGKQYNIDLTTKLWNVEEIEL